MEVNCGNFKDFIAEKFIKLPGSIDIEKGKGRLEEADYQRVTSSPEAKRVKNVIYIWQTEKPIPRLKGESNIIYIGQTKRTIFARHGNSKIKANSEANRQKYNDIVTMYGPITISYIELSNFDPEGNSDLLKAEGQFLWWYFQNHSEYPPINYTKTKVRNSSVEVNI